MSSRHPYLLNNNVYSVVFSNLIIYNVQCMLTAKMRGCLELQFSLLSHSNLNSGKKKPNIPPTRNFDLGEAVLGNYIILSKFLSYLSYNDMYNLAQVNEEWSMVVEKYIAKRQKPYVFSLIKAPCIGFNTIMIKPSFCILLQKYRGDVTFTDYTCIHFDKTPARKQLIEFLDGDLLPNKIPILHLTCRKIYSTFTIASTFHGVIYPNIEDVKIRLFRLPYERIPETDDTLKEEIGDQDVACLLVYGILLRPSYLQYVISHIQTGQPNVQFACGGGAVRGQKTFNIINDPRLVQNKDLVCIAFCKPKNKTVSFDAFSVIIPEQCVTTEEIEPHLIKLKENFTPREHGIAFRTTCTSRVTSVNTEVNLFKKHFPSVELIGFDGDGEIGTDCFTTEMEPSKLKKRKVQTEYLHFNSTSIVVMSWGKKLA